MTELRYRGRFAPSPSGPLHFGSLVTALGGYLEARAQRGEWHLRIDDLDPPRAAPGAAEEIARTLAAFGFEWDGAIEFQSHRLAAYADAFQRLQALGVVYPCACTRREIADSHLGSGVAVYAGTCRAGLPVGKSARAWRLNVQGAQAQIEDPVQGLVAADLAQTSGDFVLRRADGLFAYQLAAVVDDAALAATDVVRGADLIDSSMRQHYLYRVLGMIPPRFVHLPVAVNALGEKLSKQTLAPPLDPQHPVPALLQALHFLGQTPPPDLARASLGEIWAWAHAHWRLENVPRKRAAEP